MSASPHLMPKGHRILCVDDEPEILEALALTLGRRYRVEMAPSAAAALEVLRAAPDTTVIISDMCMPDVDGVQFLVASRLIAPNARRILLTGYSDGPSTIAAVNLGRVFKFLTKPCASAELFSAVEEAILEYEAEADERSAIRRSVEAEVLGLDPSTGLASRQRLIEQIGHAQAQAQAAGTSGEALVLIEIAASAEMLDDGEATGAERLLDVLAQRLRSSTGNARCLARYGANTFAALIAAEDTSKVALELAGMRFLDLFAAAVDLDGVALQFGVNVGIALITGTAENPRVLLWHAELAAREARRPGGNSVGVFAPESGARAKLRRELSGALRVAIAREELTVFYQPIVDLERGCLYSIEALARWENAKFGFISPGTFIPLAEEAGLMVDLGELVMLRACTDARGLMSEFCPRVSVNVSITQILEVGFMHRLYQVLEKSGIEPKALEIEVTESVFAHDIDRISALLAEVRAMGIGVAIDDFGVGYSSLANLNRLPVNILKTDAVFLRDFERGGEAIISAAVALGDKLGLHVIVEGVEEPEMLEKVRRLGATKVQGYLFARPMPLAALKRWFTEFRMPDPARISSETRASAA